MEVLNLKWSNDQSAEGRLVVRSIKPANIECCDFRFVLLRDMDPYLVAAIIDHGSERDAVSGELPMITRYNASNSNLDKPFRKIVLAAGLTPLPKLFQNLRSSCETQWIKEGARADFVANWIGHSVKVQRQN